MKTSILIAALALIFSFGAHAQTNTGFHAASKYINAGKAERHQKSKSKLAKNKKKDRGIASEKKHKAKKKKKKSKKHAEF